MFNTGHKQGLGMDREKGAGKKIRTGFLWREAWGRFWKDFDVAAG